MREGRILLDGALPAEGEQLVQLRCRRPAAPLHFDEDGPRGHEVADGAPEHDDVVRLGDGR